MNWIQMQMQVPFFGLKKPLVWPSTQPSEAAGATFIKPRAARLLGAVGTDPDHPTSTSKITITKSNGTCLNRFDLVVWLSFSVDYWSKCFRETDQHCFRECDPHVLRYAHWFPWLSRLRWLRPSCCFNNRGPRIRDRGEVHPDIA